MQACEEFLLNMQQVFLYAIKAISKRRFFFRLGRRRRRCVLKEVEFLTRKNAEMRDIKIENGN